MLMMQLGEPTTVVSSGMALKAAAEEARPSPPPPPPPPPPEASEEPDGGGEIIIGMGNDTAAATATTSSGEGEHNKMNSGGNRWPRQETLALLKIRSDMDSVFRDSSLKGPLWEEVSRKLGELGYKRSSKKCKEKFENVYKYHKRTKDSRNAKSEGKTKTYRFFDELKAFESRFTISHQPQPQPQPPPKSLSHPPNLPPNTTLTTLPFLSRPSDHSSTTFSYVTGVTTTTTTTTNTTVPSSNNHTTAPNANFSTSTSSSTDSDEDLEERYRKKRKWKDYFRRLTRRVLARQEEMQKRFLDTIDKRERERVALQEAWRTQEMARINREHEILVQERSTAASKDAAIIAFLQKISGGSQPQPPPPPPPPMPPVSVAVVASQFQRPPQQQQQQHQSQQSQVVVMMPSNNIGYEKFEIQKMGNNNNHNINGGSGGGSSRWPTAEVHALIRLRTSLEAKYQENSPKAPLWEEVSKEMQKLGYKRNAKRCKEKWENINKYFKKIKESNKQRREDSKTCPYYNELEALYKEKTKNHNNNNFFGNSLGHNVEPLMVQPEQQWRPPTKEEEEAARDYASRQYQECEEEEEEDGGSIDLEDEEGGGDGGGGNGGSENDSLKKKLSSVDTVG